jgi:hypothetical protein
MYQFNGWNLAEWKECLTVNTIVTTVMGLIPASSDKVEFEGQQMKQCWIKYRENKKIPQFYRFPTNLQYIFDNKWYLEFNEVKSEIKIISHLPVLVEGFSVTSLWFVVSSLSGLRVSNTIAMTSQSFFFDLPPTYRTFRHQTKFTVEALPTFLYHSTTCLCM